MMVMTAKVDSKKILLGIVAVAAVILALILLLGGKDRSTQTAAPTVSGNDARVQFLNGFGWDVASSPVESGQVRIPEKTSEVFDRYNALQKSQGYDLTNYSGKNVMRYVYKINNYPGTAGPVYATLLIYKNNVIGGDVTDTASAGKIHGFQKAEQVPSTVPETTAAPTATGSAI